MISKKCKLCGDFFVYPENQHKMKVDGTILVRYPICPRCYNELKDVIIRECNMKPISNNKIEYID